MIPRPWRPPLAWAAVVALITSVPAPAAPIMESVAGIDKLVHAAMYGVLGYLAVRAAGERSRAWTSVAATLLGVLCFAALDEWHQAVIPGRSADVLDWVADGVGAIAGAALHLGLSRSERYT